MIALITVRRRLSILTVAAIVSLGSAVACAQGKFRSPGILVSHESTYFDALITPASDESVLTEDYDVMPLVNEFYETLNRSEKEKNARLQRIYTSVFELKMLLEKQKRNQQRPKPGKNPNIDPQRPESPKRPDQAVPAPIPLDNSGANRAGGPRLNPIRVDPRDEPITPLLAEDDSLQKLRDRYPAELLQQVTEKPINRVALADSLFAVGELQMAHDIYKDLDEGGTTEQQFWIRFQLGNCLRRLGKRDAAIIQYRALTSNEDAGFLAESSRWWLRLIDERAELEDRVMMFDAAIKEKTDELKKTTPGAGAAN